MKKTISIILIIIGVLSISSCRQDNETIIESSIEPKTSNRAESSKNTDSTLISNYSEFDGDDTIGETSDGDPPPKKGGQWKITN